VKFGEFCSSVSQDITQSLLVFTSPLYCHVHLSHLSMVYMRFLCMCMCFLVNNTITYFHSAFISYVVSTITVLLF